MSGTDRGGISITQIRGDLALGFGLLTRIPVPFVEGRSVAGAAWSWPVVGALVGGLGGLVAAVAAGMGLGPTVAAALAVTAGIVLTGALHEDGLADCADGFWGGRDRARRLEIMRDSRIGTYGVLALGLSLILRVALLSGLIAGGHGAAALILAGAQARAAMAVAMATLPFARTDGLGHRTGQPPGQTVMAGLAIAAVLGVVFAGVGGLLALGIALGAAALLGGVARAKIGGQTGDVLGAAEQLAEITVLIVLTVALI